METNAVLDEQMKHCDGKDCACLARCRTDCVCDCDWTPAEVYRLQHEVNSLLQDAQRYRFLKTWGRFIDRGARIDAGISTPTWSGQWDSFDQAIDAQMLGANA